MVEVETLHADLAVERPACKHCQVEPAGVEGLLRVELLLHEDRLVVHQLTQRPDQPLVGGDGGEPIVEVVDRLDLANRDTTVVVHLGIEPWVAAPEREGRVDRHLDDPVGCFSKRFEFGVGEHGLDQQVAVATEHLDVRLAELDRRHVRIVATSHTDNDEPNRRIRSFRSSLRRYGSLR